MKGILLFDNLNDVAFYDIDVELSQHIQKLGIKDGLIETFSVNEEKRIDKNVLMQLFSPLIASYKVMQGQFGNKYRYVESEDGLLLVFDEVLNYVAVSICHEEEKLEEVQKELSLFLIVVEMLFGPTLHLLKGENIPLNESISRSELIVLILNKWRVLKSEQQIYLVEAVERLIINQDITAMCINLLQVVLEKVRQTHKDGTYLHAFVLVDTKLLALYSSRNSGHLSKEILLFLILIVQVLKTPTTTSKSEEIENPLSDDEFFIPISNVTKAALLNEENQTKKSSGFKEEESKVGSHSLLIYLKSRAGLLVPHILYIIEVTNRITLTILYEFTAQGVLSGNIASLIKQLNNLLYHPLQRHPMGNFVDLERDFKKLTDMLWKMKAPVDRERHVRRLITKWDQLKQSDLEEFFKNPKNKITNPRLESGLSSCCELLMTVFEDIIARPCLQYEQKSHLPDHQEIFKVIQKLSVKRLSDVADFLEVKSVQNITMASYITDYPGLIHFIYIDRNCDCMIAPIITLKKTHLNGTPSLKLKIWKMVSTGRKYIDGAENFCCLWKDGDLNFFYHVWFEDSTGRVIKPTVQPSVKKLPKKGIMCGNYYKKLIKECFPGAAHNHIHCYEFFSAHLSSTDTDVIIEHSKKLCAQLWNFTGAYRTSLDLL
ncbi:BLOC-3 complex member HPS1 isoform X2 [Parasteatoda tepidariorum]